MIHFFYSFSKCLDKLAPFFILIRSCQSQKAEVTAIISFCWMFSLAEKFGFLEPVMI